MGLIDRIQAVKTEYIRVNMANMLLGTQTDCANSQYLDRNQRQTQIMDLLCKKEGTVDIIRGTVGNLNSE